MESIKLYIDKEYIATAKPVSSTSYDPYHEFLLKKQKQHIQSGFDVNESELNKHLFSFQKFIVKRALKAGKYAIFADCGLGKTIMQLVWAKCVSDYTKKPVLILCPLAVSGQTIKEGEKFGIKVTRFGSGSIQIANYEQIDNIACSIFGGIVLDESSILKNFTGVYKNKIIKTFAQTHYKLACTATPAPNDLNEIGNHAEFLDVMDANDMRMRWFIRDEGMNNYRLKHHATDDFYGWIASWASVLRMPSDIGFADDGYVLPPLVYKELCVKAALNPKQGELFNANTVNATSFNRELKITLVPRMGAAADIVNNSAESFIIWCNQDGEEDELKRLITDAVAVRGSEKQEAKEKKLLGFANDDFRVLVTKKKIGQFGLNYQNCHNQIFAALDFSFEGLYQAIRRSYRFGQSHEVNIYIVTTDTMQNVIKSINNKQKQFEHMMNEITKQVNKKTYGLKFDYNRREVKTEQYRIVNGDTCDLIKEIPDNSIDLSVFSPPFSTLFTYSDNIRDMGNCASDEEFFQQNEFMLKDLYRVIKPGRLVCVHTKDLARYKNSSDFSGLWDFTGEYHRAMERAGFMYHSKITIWLDPVLEMQRTKTQRLLYKQVTDDSTYSGIGMPEYITIFRKWEGDERDWTPVNNLTKENFPLDDWQEWASPVYKENIMRYEKQELINTIAVLKAELFRVKYGANAGLPDSWYDSVWFDIKRPDVLNNYKGASEQKDEKHIAPLQLEVIRRCIEMWSNKGEDILDPFAGIGSTLYEAVKCGRKGIGFELKESYFDMAKKNIESVIINQSTNLFANI